MSKEAAPQLPEDLEIEAMGSLSRALTTLDPDARARVLRWASERYGIGLPPGTPGVPAQHDAVAPAPAQAGDLADLFDAANPTTQGEKVLVVAYWLQEVGGQPELESQEINDHLKHLGHGIPNITMALNDLMVRKPRLAIQTRKSGTTKQARKRYRLTTEGIRRVRSMIDRRVIAARDAIVGVGE